MRIKQMVRCPNCGALAKRESFNQLLSNYIKGSEKAVIKTECKSCDYLMIMGRYDGTVVEAYAPGLSF
ncbi:MAG: replication restart DNA helicase PriA [Cyanobacteria bacterium J06633_8]